MLCVVYDIILYRPATSIGYQLVVLTALQATPTYCTSENDEAENRLQQGLIILLYQTEEDNIKTSITQSHRTQTHANQYKILDELGN